MDINLDKIDVIRDRTGIDYSKAKKMLEDANGDVLEALIAVEESYQKKGGMNGCMMKDRAMELLHQGNATRVQIKKDQRTLLDIPVTVGAACVVLMPKQAAVLTAAALILKCALSIEKEDKTTIEVGEMLNEKIEGFKKSAKKKAEAVREAAEDAVKDGEDMAEEFVEGFAYRQKEGGNCCGCK